MAGTADTETWPTEQRTRPCNTKTQTVPPTAEQTHHTQPLQSRGKEDQLQETGKTGQRNPHIIEGKGPAEAQPWQPQKGCMNRGKKRDTTVDLYAGLMNFKNENR